MHDPRGDSLLSRVVTPLLLLAPLTIGLLLFGIVYGWRSSQLAAEIDILASSLIIESPNGARIVPDHVCPDARSELAGLSFHRLDPNDPSRKSSISGLGFDRGVIDLKGWLENPKGEDIPIDTDRSAATDEGVAGQPRSGAPESERAADGESAAEGGTTAAASNPAAQDNRDDITLELRRSDRTWCVIDVAVR